MAISTVRVQMNGSWYDLSKQSDGSWQATLTAPNTTSFNLDGGYYPLTIEAVNDAGTKGTGSLQLFVKERVAPVITIVSPGAGAYVTNNKQPVVFTVTDESGGSGVNLDSLVVTLDGTAVAASTLSHTAITNGYSFTYTPAAALGDGSHTVEVNCSDNDGNAAVAKYTSFTVDTVPPTLVINSPTDGAIVATQTLAVSGKTNDATSSPVTVRISLNGTDQGTVSVGSDGSWSKTVQLAEGDNTIVITVTDAAGKVTSATKTVRLDTSVPKIKSAVANPNPVDAGKTMVITVVVE